MTNADRVIGFIGLGQMGGPMAANIAKAGYRMVCYDRAGTAALMPEGATAGNSIADVIKGADTVFLSLPNGPIMESVAEEIAAVDSARAALIIDLSTVGPDASRSAARRLSLKQIGFGDAPVSGGRAGAIKASISLMYSGDKAIFDDHYDVFKSFAANPFHVGDEPGQGQTVKMLNNFLSATNMVATSEAVVFGLSQGLDMKMILDVVNVSSGANSASQDKFVNRILPETYDAGFFAELLNKDVQLYISNVRAAGTPSDVGEVVAGLWQAGVDSFEPRTDFTNIYKFIRDRRSKNKRNESGEA
ncbi:MAG: NAD(P)-dependent oxidoreductase [Alphaproteobacteria bacterium]|nr:NAD(P)-dependent oxidoreductase [Alphaproteobacteria bacterium]